MTAKCGSGVFKLHLHHKKLLRTYGEAVIRKAFGVSVRKDIEIAMDFFVKARKVFKEHRVW